MGTASEELEIKVLGGLYSVTEENLKKLLVHLKITATAVEGKTKRQVLKVARNAIEAGVQAAETEDEAITYIVILTTLSLLIIKDLRSSFLIFTPKNSQFLKPQNLLQLLLISICFSREIEATI